MSTFTKACSERLNRAMDGLGLRGKKRQWAWFFILWLAGLGGVLTLGYTIKFFMGLI